MSDRVYKAVVFDMDGVIFDSEKCVLESWKEVAGKHNIENVESVFVKCLGTNYDETKKKFLDYYGDDFPYDEYKKECSAIYHLRYDDGRLPMKKGIRELLSYLKEQGYLIGLASSTRLAVIEHQLKAAGIYDYFDNLTSGDMLKKSKPEPDIYLMACENLGVKPEEAIAIEDSYNGVRAAYRAGMCSVMVPDMVAPDEEMKSISSYIFNSLIEMKEWFEESGKLMKSTGDKILINDKPEKNKGIVSRTIDFLSDFLEKDVEHCLYWVSIFIVIIMAIFFPIMIFASEYMSSQGVQTCMMKEMWGIPCPGCGGTRAVYALLKGKIFTSIYYHALVPYTVVMYAIFFITQTLQRITKGKIKGMKYRNWYFIVALVILVVQFVLKLAVPGYNI